VSTHGGGGGTRGPAADHGQPGPARVDRDVARAAEREPRGGSETIPREGGCATRQAAPPPVVVDVELDHGVVDPRERRQRGRLLRRAVVEDGGAGVVSDDQGRKDRGATLGALSGRPRRRAKGPGIARRGLREADVPAHRGAGGGDDDVLREQGPRDALDEGGQPEHEPAPTRVGQRRRRDRRPLLKASRQCGAVEAAQRSEHRRHRASP